MCPWSRSTAAEREGAASAVLCEEVREQFGALVTAHPVRHLDPMVEARVVTHVVQAVARTGLEIRSPVDHAIDAAVDQCSPTHQTGLECDHESAAIETPGPYDLCGITKSKHFGVRCWVAGELPLVVSARDNRSVLDYHGANGNIAMGKGEAGFVERKLHQFIVGHRRSIGPPQNAQETE